MYLLKVSCKHLGISLCRRLACPLAPHARVNTSSHSRLNGGQYNVAQSVGRRDAAWNANESFVLSPAASFDVK